MRFNVGIRNAILEVQLIERGGLDAKRIQSLPHYFIGWSFKLHFHASVRKISQYEGCRRSSMDFFDHRSYHRSASIGPCRYTFLRFHRDNHRFHCEEEGT